MNDKIQNILGDIQLICMCLIMVNSGRMLEDGFSWLALGGFICGTLLVGIALYMKHFPEHLSGDKK